MNPALVIGVVVALTGILQAAYSFGLSRSKAWPETGPFALVAATASCYCVFDLALMLDLSPRVTAIGLQAALMFGALHGVAWLRYLAASDRRLLGKPERWMSVFGLGLAACALVPGLLTTREIITVQIDWADVTYRTPKPTLVGVMAYLYFAAALVVIGVGSARRWHEGGRARFPIVGVVILGVLAINDTLASAGMLSMPMLFDAGSIVVVVVVGILHQSRFAASAFQLELSSTRLEYEVAIGSRELLETQATLARSERLASVGRLAAGVAHEINNPITVVQHSLERLQRQLRERGELNVDGVPYVEGALVATHRIARIVRQLLDAGRATSLGPSRLVPFAVAPVVRRAVVAARGDLGSLPVVVDIDGNLAARGDAASTEHVLVNILTNAAHTLEQRPSDGRVEIRASCVDNSVVMTITDNGPGIAPAVRESLFEPFVSTKAVGRGSGLGLAVSLGLMRSQQGDLRLADTSDAGTTMMIELPWSADAPALGEHRSSVEPGPGRLRLLIIDDDEDVRGILQDIASEHFHVEAASTIDEAFARIGRAPAVDVVLCDLMMPDGGADAWLARCREGNSALLDRTIVITGGPTTPAAAALVDLYVDRVLYKPFAVADLRALVARIVSAGALARS